MVSTNTKMYNLRWAAATPSVDDDKNSKLYKYSGQRQQQFLRGVSGSRKRGRGMDKGHFWLDFVRV